MKIPFGKLYRGVDIGEIPDTYLDWLLGQKWFFEDKRNNDLAKEITKELVTRKRSYYFIPDKYGKTLEDL